LFHGLDHFNQSGGSYGQGLFSKDWNPGVQAGDRLGNMQRMKGRNVGDVNVIARKEFLKAVARRWDLEFCCKIKGALTVGRNDGPEIKSWMVPDFRQNPPHDAPGADERPALGGTLLP